MLRANWKRTVALTLALGFASLNAAAYLHARAMMRFVPSGARTAQPERLGFGAKVRTLLTGVTVPRPTNTTTPAAFGLTFTTTRIPDANGGLEAWVIRPSGATRWALLFHGYAGSKSELLV